ncbi:MAG: prepilin peptidase [Lachnospiraceae bacterium]
MQLEILLLVFLAAAVVTDFRSWKIPNALILSGLLVGSAGQLYFHGLKGFAAAWWQLWTIFWVLFFLFRMRAIGAGDLKLFIMSGLFLQKQDIFPCMISAFLCGAGFAVLKMVSEKNMKERFSYFFHYMKTCVQTRTLQHYRPKTVEASCMIHFSLPIFLGSLIYLEVIR